MPCEEIAGRKADNHESISGALVEARQPGVAIVWDASKGILVGTAQR